MMEYDQQYELGLEKANMSFYHALTILERAIIRYRVDGLETVKKRMLQRIRTPEQLGAISLIDVGEEQ